MERLGEGELQNPYAGESSAGEQSFANFESEVPSWQKHQEELNQNAVGQSATPISEIDDPGERERRLRELRAKIESLAKPNVAEAGEMVREELVDFGGAEIPEKMLGKEKVVVKELKTRPRWDFLGRRKDEGVLERLMNGDYDGEDEFRTLFTPTVAQAYLDRLNREDVAGSLHYSTDEARVFEALPLDVQVGELSTSECLGFLNAEHGSETLANKAACGLINNLERRGAGKRADKQNIEYAVLNSEKLHKKIANGGPVADLLSDEVAKKLFGALVEDGLSKFDSATVCLKSKQMIDGLEWLVNQNATVGDVGFVRDMIGAQESRDGCVYDAWRQKYETVFPLGLRRLSEADRGSDYRKCTLSEAEEIVAEMDATRDKRESLGMNEKSWNGLRRRCPSIYEQVKSEQVDEKTARILRLFTKTDLMDLMSGRVNTLDDVRNIDNLVREAADESFENDDYDMARDYIGQYAFGIGMNDMVQNLRSLGVIEVNRRKKSDEDDDDVAEFGRDRFKIGNLSVLGDMSEEQKLLLLDAIALCNCKDDGLKKKLESYKENHISFEEKEKFVELLDGAREAVCERVTDNYGRYMKEKLQANSRLVDELEYGDKKIPLLRMEGDEFMLLVHRLGAFAPKDRDDPAQWNETIKTDNASREGVGYISTAAIAKGALRLANIETEKLDDENEVFYAFVDLGKGSIKAMRETDAHTGVDYKMRLDDSKAMIVTGSQDHFYDNPVDLIKKNQEATKRWEKTYRHSEVVLDRYSGDPNQFGGRLQPSHIIVFTDNPDRISDLQKKHAAYFGVPILMIDPAKYS